MIGITHLHRKNHVLNRLNLMVPSLVTSLYALSLPQNQPINIDINIPPSGNRINEVVLSKKSKILFPRMVKPDHGPIDSEAAIHIMNNMTLVIPTAFFLLIFFSSIKYETTTSNRDMEEVNAAKASKVKNTIPKNFPTTGPMVANIAGTVINANPAPEPTSKPKATAEGTITSPASKATRVSIPGIIKALDTKFSFLLK